ncbi:MAG: replication factor C small subunit [Candidatus Anstonellales archaeon]
MDILPWVEKYRPKKLDEVIGQEHILPLLKSFVEKKSMPHLLFAGPPGVGKTTVALALAHELFGENYKTNFAELNASDERGIDVVRGKIKDFARSLSVGGSPFKIIFLDESDALTADAQQALRRTMELYSNVTRFILSCNYSSKIIEPIQSRTAVLRFFPLKEEDVKKMINKIAHAESLKVDDKAFEAIYYISEGDMRKAINILQGAAFHSKHITESLVFKVSSRAAPKEIKEMVEKALRGNFLSAREHLEKIMVSYGVSGEDVLVQIYRAVSEMEIPEKAKVKLIDRIGEYNFRLVEGADERIQLEALLAQFPVIMEEFKK